LAGQPLSTTQGRGTGSSSTVSTVGAALFGQLSLRLALHGIPRELQVAVVQTADSNVEAAVTVFCSVVWVGTAEAVTYSNTYCTATQHVFQCADALLEAVAVIHTITLPLRWHVIAGEAVASHRLWVFHTGAAMPSGCH